MKLTVTLKRSYLHAALVTAASADVRHYLNGVLVEIHRDHAFLVGCDGHRLSVLRDADGGCEDAPETGIEFVIPRAAAKTIKGTRPLDAVRITYDTETEMVAIDDFGTVTTVKRVDGLFPDWRRVVPKTASREPAQFDATYLADLEATAKALGAKPNYVALHHNGSGSALVTIDSHPEFVGVLMPMRNDAPPKCPISSFGTRPPKPGTPVEAKADAVPA